MEIKQLKRFFFCLYFNPVLGRNSFTRSVLQMYIGGNLVQRNSTCILYFGDVTFGYVELRITRSIFSTPLDFEITRLTCSLYHLDSHTKAFTASTCHSRWRSQMRLTLKKQSEYGMFCPGWQKWHGMLCPGWQKWHGILCPGWQKQRGWQIFVGCFVGVVKKWHGMFCPGMFCPAP